MTRTVELPDESAFGGGFNRSMQQPVGNARLASQSSGVVQSAGSKVQPPHRGIAMFRKLVLPLAAAALLAGCATTAPYGYRDGQGDYYYGRPSVEYRDHGVYPGGYPYYGPYRPGFYGSFRYGWPYGYYGYPYYGRPYYRPIHGPVHRPHPHAPDTRPDGGAWRNFDELHRRHDGGEGAMPTPGPAMPLAPREPRTHGEGSRMGEMIRRTREGHRGHDTQDE